MTDTKTALIEAVEDCIESALLLAEANQPADVPWHRHAAECAAAALIRAGMALSGKPESQNPVFGMPDSPDIRAHLRRICDESLEDLDARVREVLEREA